MLNISKASQYGLRAVTCLADPEIRDTTPSIQYIAEWEKIPEAYLRKLVLDLKRAGIVRTIKGQYGGIQLAKDPEAISVLDILEATGEEVYLNKCVMQPSVCSQYKECTIRFVWIELTYWLRDHLNSTSIAELLKLQELCEAESSQDAEIKDYTLQV